jgi:hypothetical protein
MAAAPSAALCSSCAGRLARDNTGTICSPCRRTQIETSAQRGAASNRGTPGIKAAFDSHGLHGVAQHLGCTPDEALDALLNSRLLPFVSARRRSLLRKLIGLGGSSHTAAGEALNVSRWTVATYRRELGIDRAAAASTSAS